MRQASNLNEKTAYAFMEISLNGDYMGKVIFELFTDICPKSTERFLDLCSRSFHYDKIMNVSYEDSKIDRIVKEGFVEGGEIEDFKEFDEKRAKQGVEHNLCCNKKPYMIDDESYHFKHDQIGILGFSKSDGLNHTGVSKFYVTTAAPLTYLDKKTVAFGRVVQGMRVFNLMRREKTISEKPISCI